MKPTFVHRGRAAVVCALLASTRLARADEATVVPPRLTRFVEAVDPRGATASNRESVELELEIDEHGAVKSARVARSGGDALDAAALVAARQLAFEPATRGGQPSAARIRYEYVFVARDAAPPKAPPAPTLDTRPAVVTGVILDAETREPIAGANVEVTTDAGPSYRTKTDAKGTFRIDGAVPGPAHVVVTAEGHTAVRLDETLEPATATNATLPLERTPDPEAFVATARVDAPPREVTKRRLDRAELASVAGTRGDPLRAVELLPGVSRPSSAGNGMPILRGANPFDSQVFMEGAPVPTLFHVGGLTSFVHSRVLDGVELYPSNFSVRYGRKVGGVIEARLRDPRTDAVHGIAELSLLDSSLLVETPLGEKVSVLATARRSNIDVFLGSAANSSDLAITAAPVYWDYQAVATYKPTDDDRLRLLAYGSSDRLALVVSNPSDAEPALRGAFDFSTVFHRVQLGYRHRFRGGSEQNTELTYGRTMDRGRLGAFGQFEVDTDLLQARSEWTGVISPAVRVIGGLDLLTNHFDGTYRGIPADVGEGDPPRAISTERHVELDATQWVAMPGAYLEAGLRPFPELLVSPGLRADYNNFIGRASVDPRISARFDVTPRTAFKAGMGRFSQSPDERHAIASIGNPDLRMTHALHASAGVEQQVTDTFSVSLEGFGKRLENVVTATPDGEAPFFTNDQDGRIFGGELMLRVKPRGRFFGFVAYTLQRSERRDEGRDWRLFDRDQPHVVNAAGVYRLGRGWELGATVRYTSGTPYTPVTSATYDATADVYSPRVGRAMSARNPAFSRVDVRVQKTWTFSKWSLAAYLDIQNMLNSPNREGFDYSYDYGQRRGVRGLPILPMFGLRGEL